MPLVLCCIPAPNTQRLFASLLCDTGGVWASLQGSGCEPVDLEELCGPPANDLTLSAEQTSPENGSPTVGIAGGGDSELADKDELISADKTDVGNEVKPPPGNEMTTPSGSELEPLGGSEGVSMLLDDRSDDRPSTVGGGGEPKQYSCIRQFLMNRAAQQTPPRGVTVCLCTQTQTQKHSHSSHCYQHGLHAPMLCYAEEGEEAGLGGRGSRGGAGGRGGEEGRRESASGRGEGEQTEEEEGVSEDRQLQRGESEEYGTRTCRTAAVTMRRGPKGRAARVFDLGAVSSRDSHGKPTSWRQVAI